jgi:hypothetical protein
MNAIRRFFLLSVVILSFIKTNAQTDRYHYELGVNAGTLLYQGDLIQSPFGSFKGASPMLQVSITKPFSPYLSWRGNVTIGAISADESRFSTPFWKQLRNFSFSSPVTEFTGMLQLNIYGDNGKESYHTFTPYLMAGAGLSFLNIHRDWSRVDTTAFSNKSSLGTGLGIDSLHTLPRMLPVLPLGAGVRWMVTPRLAVNAEATMRFGFSDYIDGFSYAADHSHNDSYYGISVGVNFILGENGVKCPRVQK